MSKNAEQFETHRLRDRQGRGWLVYRLAPGGTAEIVEIEVESTYRRRGVGRELLDTMTAGLPDDVVKVFAFTRATNYIAQDWYEALGFVRHDVTDFYGDDDRDAVLYVKRVMVRSEG
jgi:ribosomal protein S18 acetylase RimI-like enzyme